MISNSFNPLQNPFFNPLQSNFPNSTPIDSENKKNQVFQTIFQYLIENKTLDENGNLNLHDLKIPELDDIQLERLNSLLTKKFTIKARENKFEFETSLKEIFEFLKVDEYLITSIEIVGGTVFWILGPDYMKKIMGLLKIPEDLVPPNFYEEFKNPAADIDIRVPCLGDPKKWLKPMCDFFRSKLKNLTTNDVIHYGFTKLYHYPSFESTTHSVLSFGNPENFAVDLLFVKNLERKNLFIHDALKLDVSCPGKPFRNQKLNTNSSPILQALIYRLTKTLDADDIEGIDLTGCSMLFANLTRGWSYYSKEFESILLSKFFESKDYNYLTKALKNHFPNNPTASFVLYYNVLSLLPEGSKEDILKIANAILPNKRHLVDVADPLTTLQDAMLLLQDENLGTAEKDSLFEIITFYFQIFAGFYSLTSTKDSKTSVNKIMLKNEPHLQLQFQEKKPLCITLKNDFNFTAESINKKFQSIRPDLKASLLLILQNLNEYFTFNGGNDFNLDRLEKDSVVTDFNAFECSQAALTLLDIREISLNKIGFYLLALSGIKTGNHTYLNLLVSKCLELITIQTVTERINTYCLLVKYWLSSTPLTLQNRKSLENCYKALNNQNYHAQDILKAFCLNFASFEQDFLTQIIMNIWEQRPEIFNDQSNLDLAEKFFKHSPTASLKIVHLLIQKSLQPKNKKLFDSLFNWYLNPNNEISFYRDIKLLGAVTNLVVKAEKPVNAAKKEDADRYMRLSKALLDCDFVLGIELLKIFEEKKLINKGFTHICSEKSAKDKLTLTLKLNQHSPIDYTKTSSSILEERLELLLNCISTDLDETTKELLTSEVLKLLENISTHKFQVSKKFKDILKPKFEWLLLQLLNTSNRDQNSITSYFKIIESFDHTLFSNKKIAHLIFTDLKNLLISDKSLENCQFVKEKISKINPKNSSNINVEELSLYEELVSCSTVDIADEFLKKIFQYLYDKKESPTDLLLNVLDNILNKYIKSENFLSHRNLLNFVEKLFPDILILNEKMHWEKVVLNLSEELKKLELLLKKAKVFSDSTLIKQEAEKICFFYLTKFEKDKGKLKSEYLNTILKLIEDYTLNTSTILNKLTLIIPPLKNKKFNTQTFTVLDKIKTPITLMVPFIESTYPVNKEILIHYLNDPEGLLKQLEGAEMLELRQRMVYILSKTFIETHKKRTEENFKIYDAFSVINDEISILSIEKQAELLLLNIKNKMSYLEEGNTALNTLSSISWLCKQKETLEQTTLLFSYFSEVVLFFENKYHPEENLDTYINGIIESLNERITLSNLRFVIEEVIKNSSLRLFNMSSKMILKIFDMHSKEELTPLELLVKKFIISCINKRYDENLDQLVSLHVFTEQDTFEFDGIYCLTLFTDESTIECPDKISEALYIYSHVVKSPYDTLDLQKMCQEGAIKHLTALLFRHNKENEYFEYLNRILEVLTENVDNKKFLEFLDSRAQPSVPPICLLKKSNLVENTLSEIHLEVMQKRCFSFMISLIEKINAIDLNISKIFPQDALVGNYFNILYLDLCFKEKTVEEQFAIVKAIYNYALSSTILMPNHFKQAFLCTRILTKNLGESNFNVNKEWIPTVFKLSAFTEIGLKSFNVFIPTFHSELILNMVSEIMSYRTLSSFVVAHDYLESYQDTLLKGISTKALEVFIEHFYKVFSEHYPAYTYQPWVHLKNISNFRKSTKNSPVVDEPAVNIPADLDPDDPKNKK